MDLFLDEGSMIMGKTKEALRKYSWAYPFVGLNGLLVTFFASLGKGRMATVLSILRTPVAISLSMYLTRNLLPDYMIWYVLAFSEALVFPVGLYFLMKYIVIPLRYRKRE